jgi:hypothetical protein
MLIGFTCDDVDIFVHTQRICSAPIKLCNKSMVHILDLQDQPRAALTLLPQMDGEILLSKKATETHCITKLCFRCSFAFNLHNCYKVVNKERELRRRMNKTSTYRMVGLVGNSRDYGTIAGTLRRANISFTREYFGKASIKKTCEFYSQITLAIAWSPYIPTNRSGHKVMDQKTIDYWHGQKPPERFCNPQWFDIPTIGYSEYSSFQAYGNEFLCGTDQCVLDLMARIEAGEMDRDIARVRERVRRDTDEKEVGLLLRTFLHDSYFWKNTNITGQVFYGNYSDLV